MFGLTWNSKVRKAEREAVAIQKAKEAVQKEKEAVQKEKEELEAKLANIPITVDLAKVTPTAEALALVPRNVAVENSVLPLSIEVEDLFSFSPRRTLKIAMENPADIPLIDNLLSLSCRIHPVLPIGSLSKAIQKAYNIAPTPTPTSVDKNIKSSKDDVSEQLGDRVLSEEELNLLPPEAITAYIARRREKAKEKVVFSEEVRAEAGEVKKDMKSGGGSLPIVPVDPRKRNLVLNAMLADELMKLAEAGSESLLRQKEERIERIRTGQARPEDLPQELRWTIGFQQKRIKRKPGKPKVEERRCSTCGKREDLFQLADGTTYQCWSCYQADDSVPPAKSPAEWKKEIIVVGEDEEVQKLKVLNNGKPPGKIRSGGNKIKQELSKKVFDDGTARTKAKS